MREKKGDSLREELMNMPCPKDMGELLKKISIYLKIIGNEDSRLNDDMQKNLFWDKRRIYEVDKEIDQKAEKFYSELICADALSSYIFFDENKAESYKGIGKTGSFNEQLRYKYILTHSRSNGTGMNSWAIYHSVDKHGVTRYSLKFFPGVDFFFENINGRNKEEYSCTLWGIDDKLCEKETIKYVGIGKITNINMDDLRKGEMITVTTQLNEHKFKYSMKEKSNNPYTIIQEYLNVNKRDCKYCISPEDFLAILIKIEQDEVLSVGRTKKICILCGKKNNGIGVICSNHKIE